MRKALLLAAALAALALPGAAGAYSLPAADISVRIAPDGSLLIAEHITIEGAFHGAYRDIPLRKGESIDRIQLSEQGEKYTRGGSTKLGSIDTPHTFNYELHKNKVRIVWHFSAGGEPHTYTVAYRFRGLAVAYSDIVDVNLKVWGANWSAPVSDLRATMALPKPTPLGPLYNVWGHPAWVKGVVERTKPAALLRAVNVSAGQFVEMRVTFPRSLLRSTGGAKVVPGPGLAKVKKEEADDQADYLHDQEKIDDAKHHLARTLVFLALLGIGPALAWMILVWALYGRERGTGYDREYEQAPPTDTEPALVPPLLRQDKTAGSQEFTATLFDLIRRGRYKSTPVTTERKVWGGLRHQDVSDLLLTPGDTSMSLREFEGPVAEVIDSVVDTDGERLSELREKIEKNRTSNAKRFTSFKNAVGSAIDGKKWYVEAGGAMLGLGLVIFIVLAVVLLWIGVDGWRSASPRWSDVVIVALGGCAVANAVAARARADAREDVAAALEGRHDRGRALGGLPPLPDRLPPAPGGAARDARALGALPRLRDRVRDRGARAPGRPPAHARGAARPEHDLLDQPDRRPRLGAERAGDRRPLVRVRLGAVSAELGRWRRLLRRRRRWRGRRRRRRLVSLAGTGKLPVRR